MCFYRFDEQLRVVDGTGRGRLIADALPDGVVAPSDTVWRAVLSGEVRRFELSTPDERGLHLAVATPVTDEAGRVIGGMAVTFDASHRHQAELKLRERETEFRSLAEHATDIVTRHAPDGTVLYVSPSVSEFGIEPGYLVGRPIYDLVHEEDRDRVRRSVDPAIRAGQTITVAYRLRTGEDDVRWLETTCAGISDDDGRVTEVRCSTQDITARHRDAKESSGAWPSSPRWRRSASARSPACPSETSCARRARRCPARWTCRWPWWSRSNAAAGTCSSPPAWGCREACSAPG